MSIRKTQQQKISSLRRKDSMWIYKNPQGLQILEDELNERRKKRSARYRKSPPMSDKSDESKYQELPETRQISSQKRKTRPAFNNNREENVDNALIPIARKIEEPNTINIATMEELKPFQVEDRTDMNTITTIKQPSPLKLEEAPKTSNAPAIDELKVKAQEKQKESSALFPKEPKSVKVEEKPIISNSITSNVSKATSVEEKPSKVKEMLKRAEIFKKDTPEIKRKPIAKVPEKISKIWDSNKSIDLAKASVNEHKHSLEAKPTAFTRDQNMFYEAKQKLVSVQQNKVASKVEDKQSVISTPVKIRGLVSSFVSVYESPSTEAKPTNDNKLNAKSLFSKTESVSPVTSRLAAMGPPPKPPRHVRSPSPAATLSSPELSTPSPISTVNSYFTLAPSFSEVLPTHHREFAHCEKEIASKHQEVTPKIDGDTKAVMHKMAEPLSSESIINVYLPQLSPEISFYDDGSTLDILDKEGTKKEKEIDVDTPERPCIKKRVSFSDQLLTYIPDEDNSSISNSTDSSSISSCFLDRQSSKQADDDEIPLSTFTRTVRNELSEILVTEKKANSASTRNKFVPAVVMPVKKQEENISSLRRPGSIASNSPQRLSNKLLDIFQQKLSHNNETKTPPPQRAQSPPTTRGLTHLTKTRPRKPPSLKKPTYPAATAQPDWRMRATNKKYEFVV